MDEAGNRITTSYVDLRAPENRTAIRALETGCRENTRWWRPRRFSCRRSNGSRRGGENLIRDEQEGLVTEGTETVDPETPEEAIDLCRDADMKEAIELLDSGMRTTSRAVKRSGNDVDYGKEWWVFPTGLTPDPEEVWAVRRASLDPAFDHESVIGRPAKFAQALGQMVTEQLGLQGKFGELSESFGEEQSVRSRHSSLLILHGPVVYADRLHDESIRDGERTGCRSDSGCFRHQVRGNLAVTVRYPLRAGA